MIVEEERSAFERWLKDEDTDQDVFGGYCDGLVQCQWRAWTERARLADMQILEAMEK